MSYHNDTETCETCGTKFELTTGHPRREYKKGIWTGRWLCTNCWQKGERKERFLANRRTGNLDPNSPSGKGDIFEEITCRIFNVTNLNWENDNFCTPIDHSRHPVLGILQSKGAIYNPREKFWGNSGLYYEHGKEFDNVIFYCVKYEKIVRIYIIPRKEVMNRTGIYVYENPARYVWYERFRVKDEGLVKLCSDEYQNILKEIAEGRLHSFRKTMSIQSEIKK